MNANVSCVADTDTQETPKIGHISAQPTEPFGLRTPWLHFTKAIELRRLAKLQARINRLEARRAEIVSERQLIMNRCIRRMRRQDGKN